MEARSNIEWRQWARTDPLFGVSTLPGRERDGERPWTLPEFYESGERAFGAWLPQWEQYGRPTGHCLEIGSGAGRITRQLAQHFDAVTGVDVAPNMLDIAREQVPDATFVLSDGLTLPAPDGSMSAVFSCEVFQHFDNRELALANFREIHRVLEPGGTCLIQLPLAILPFRRMNPRIAVLQRKIWRASEGWVRLKSNVKRQLIKNRNRRPFLFMLQYEPDWLYEQLTSMGLKDIEIRQFAVPQGEGIEFYAHVLARK